LGWVPGSRRGWGWVAILYVLTVCCVSHSIPYILCPVPICGPWNSEFARKQLDHIVFELCSTGANLVVVIEQHNMCVIVVQRFMHIRCNLWGVRVPLCPLFVRDPVFLLHLLSYFLLCADALLVDFHGFLWGQPELHSCWLCIGERWGACCMSWCWFHCC
jgi:hypothetical protein